MNSRFEKKLQKFVQNRLEKADVAHDYSHISRVVSLVRKLTKNRLTNTTLVITAAYLHDISYRDESNKHEDHVAKSKEIAKKYLEQQKCFTYKEINQILDIMDAGSSENYLAGKLPMTFEQKALQDAGILDVVGAVGLARLFAFSGHFGENFQQSCQYLEQNIKKRVSHLQTPEAKKLGKQRLKFIELFQSQYQKEVLGVR